MSDEHNVCPVERAGFLTSRLRSVLQNPEKILGPYIKKGYTSVDIGCGPGFFTCPMAEMAGEDGRVIAVDLQAGMLEKLRQRADERGLLSRIEICRADTDSLNVGLKEGADFVLAFYMVHEVRDKEGLFKQICDILKPGGKLLIIEPGFHVKKEEFNRTLECAYANGFEVAESHFGLTDMRAVLMKGSR